MDCSLADLKLPEPDVRLVISRDTVFKVKLRCRNSQIAGETPEESLKFWKSGKVQYDIERVINYTLLNTDKIEPIRTDDLVIYPYKREWPNAGKFNFSKYDQSLNSSPDLLMFYIERIELPKETGNQVDDERTPVKSSDDYQIATSYSGKRPTTQTGLGSRKKRRKFSQSSQSSLSDVDNSVSSMESEDEIPTKDPGVLKTFLSYLFTPVRSLGRIWR